MLGTPAARPPRRHSRTSAYRAAVIVVATTALTITMLGIAAPAGADTPPPGHTVSSISTGANATTIAIDAASRTAYIANGPDATVSVVDLTSNAVTHTLAVGANPSGVAVDHATHTAYVTSRGTQGHDGRYTGNTVTVIDTLTNQVAATLPMVVPGLDPDYALPSDVAVDHNTGFAYVTVHTIVSLPGYRQVSVIDPASKSIVDTISVGYSPLSITIDDATHTAYVENGGQLTVIDLTTRTVSRVVDHVDGQLVAFDVATQTVWIAAAGGPPPFAQRRDVGFVGGSVSAFDLNTNRVVATVNVGGSPLGIAVDPGAHTVYVSNANGTVSVIDTVTKQLQSSVLVPAPAGLAVDQTTHTEYVAGGNGKNLRVIQNGGTAIPTTTTLAVTPNAAVGVQSVVLYAAVSGSDGGHMTFTDGGAAIAGCDNVTFTFGFAICPTAFNTAGEHALTATYTGDNTHAASSATIPLNVASQADPFQATIGVLLRYAYGILGFFGVFPIYSL